MVACFATNFLISAINGDPTKLTDPGLIRFNAFKFVSCQLHSVTYMLNRLPCFYINDFEYTLICMSHKNVSKRI